MPPAAAVRPESGEAARSGSEPSSRGLFEKRFIQRQVRRQQKLPKILPAHTAMAARRRVRGEPPILDPTEDGGAVYATIGSNGPRRQPAIFHNASPLPVTLE